MTFKKALIAMGAGIGCMAGVVATAMPASAAGAVNATFPNYLVTSVHPINVCGKVVNPGAMGQYDIAAWGVAKTAADFNNNGPSNIGDYSYSPTSGNLCPTF